mmetsp:Transcript_49869/g.132457  ORF Transcript_49869/g.132457 Transcript_49869/m.132457 type:complete len:213 (-) Transcript_49869:391-1029(-)
MEVLRDQGDLHINARFDNTHRLLPHLLLVVLQQLYERCHEVLCNNFGPKRRAKGVEILGDRQAHTPRAILGGFLDDGDRVFVVLLHVEHLGDDQCRVHASDPDSVLGIVRRQLLIHRNDVRQDILLIAHGHEVSHLVRGSAPDHGCVVCAQRVVDLAQARFLRIACVAVGRWEEGTGSHPCSEEVGLACELLQRRHKIVRHERRLSLHDGAH